MEKSSIEDKIELIYESSASDRTDLIILDCYIESDYNFIQHRVQIGIGG